MEPSQQPSPHRLSTGIWCSSTLGVLDLNYLQELGGGSFQSEFHVQGWLRCATGFAKNIWFESPFNVLFITDSNRPPAFTMGSIYGDCWHFFRVHQGQKWA